MKKILKGLDGLKIVGADIVEVAPGELTGLRHDLVTRLNLQ
jgi:arginase family enzyme